MDSTIQGLTLDEHLGKVKALKPDGTPYPPEEMPIYNSVTHGNAVRNVEMSIERKMVNVCRLW